MNEAVLGKGRRIRNTLMISAPASRFSIAAVVKGVFTLLTDDVCAVLPRAFAQRHLPQVDVRPAHNLAEPTLQMESHGRFSPNRVW
jgi:hypothetical protein